MRTSTATLLLLLSAAAGAGPLPEAARRAVPRVVAETLPNGLRVLVAEDPRAPLVTVAVMYSVGARNEAAGSTGLAHYVEHMAFRSLRGFPGSETTEGITRIGGRWTGYTWIDQTFYAETVPREAWPRLLDLEAARMRGALFERGEFEKERTSVLAELHSYDDARSVLYDAVLAASFEIHPYRNNTIGWLSDVEGATRDEAWRFYRRYYQPGNAVLVIAGDVQAPGALALARERLGTLAADGEGTEVRTVEPAQTGMRRVTVRRPGGPPWLLAAFRAPALTEADFPAMVMLDALLAGGRGYRPLRDYAEHPEAPLARALVASGPATRAATAWQPSRYPYVVTFEAVVPRAEDLPAAEKALWGLLDEATRRAWTPDEMERARRQVLTAWALDLDDLPTRAHQLALFELAGGHQRLLEVPERLAEVTVADVQRFARERLQEDRATVGWFVPAPTPAAEHAPEHAPAPEHAGESAGTSAAGARAGAAPPGEAAVAGRSSPAPPPSSPAAVPSALTPLRLALSPVTRLRTLPTPGPLVALAARLDTGSWRQTAPAAILAELLAQPSPVTDPAVRIVRGDEDGGPSRPWIDLEVVALAGELPAAARALVARLEGALQADAPRMAAARGAAAARARERAAGAQQAALERALESLYPPGQGPSWAMAEEIEAAGDEEVRALATALLRPPRLELVAAGAVPADAGDVLTRTLLPLAGKGDRPREDPRRSGRAMGPARWTEALVERPQAAQNQIVVAWPAPAGRPFDRAARDALLYLLGETGYAGRLGRALVDPGLVYSVYTTHEDDGRGGLLRITTAASRADTAAVLQRIREVLEGAARGDFTAAELAEAEAYRRGKRARSAQSTVALVWSAVEEAREGDGEEGARLTLATLQDTARRLFERGAPVAVVVGSGR